MAGRFDAPEFDRKEFVPWTKGWYGGVILKGFTSSKGDRQFRTEDTVSKRGDSRNITLCVAAANGNEVMQKLITINYQPDSLTDERIAEVREAAHTYAKQRGAWPDKGLQRDFLCFQRLKQLETIAKQELSMNGNGFDLSPLIEQSVDVKVIQDPPNETGSVFNSFDEVAPAGTHESTKSK